MRCDADSGSCATHHPSRYRRFYFSTFPSNSFPFEIARGRTFEAVGTRPAPHVHVAECATAAIIVRC